MSGHVWSFSLLNAGMILAIMLPSCHFLDVDWTRQGCRVVFGCHFAHLLFSQCCVLHWVCGVSHLLLSVELGALRF